MADQTYSIYQVRRRRPYAELPPMPDCAAPDCDAIFTELWANVTETDSPVYRCSNGHLTEVIEDPDPHDEQTRPQGGDDDG